MKKQNINTVIGPLIFVICLFSIPTSVFGSLSANAAIGTLGWMAFWWITGAVDYAVTAFLPIAVNALFQITDMSKVISNYASETILLVLGASIITASWDETGLDKRISARFLSLIGGSIRGQVVFWYTLCFLLSAVLPNAVVCAAMTPIAVSMLKYVGIDDIGKSKIGSLILVTIAYAAGAGGLASPLGGAMNLVAVDYLEQVTGAEYMYSSWVVRFLPITVILLISNIVMLLIGVKRNENLGGSKEWVIDHEAALVVQRIFSLAIEGKGVEQIATILTEEKILTPIEYAKVKGIRKASSKQNADPYFWSKSTVNKILSQQEYCGDVINFKTYSISYKNKKRHENAPENMQIFKGIHKPIIDRTTFEKVQSMRTNTRKRRMKSGEHHIFSGLLKCADCGRTLHFHFNQGNPDIKYFNCPGYNQGKRKVCYSTHYIRADFLEYVVLKEIKRLVKFALQYEEEFIRVVNQQSKEKLVDKEAGLRSELKRKREEEKQIDRKIEELYDFCIKGLITDDRFKKFTIRFEEEQADVVSRIKVLEKELEKIEGKTATANDILSALKKYTRIRKLKPYMVHELIEYIEVHHAEKIDGVKTQRINIHYNFIGTIEIPEEAEIDQPEVSMQTRKGVTLNYQAAT